MLLAKRPSSAEKRKTFHTLAILCISATALLQLASQQVQANNHQKSPNKVKDVYKRSIVFDIKTPKVFYCPQEKQPDHGKMIVKAKPLDNLCQFLGKPKPKGEPSDCYNDLDETDFACDEKRRFMLRLDSLAESEEQHNLNQDPLDMGDIFISKEPVKKKANNGKKS